MTFTRAEQSLVDRLRTPAAVQRWLRTLPYNWEKGGETLRSFRGVVRLGDEVGQSPGTRRELFRGTGVLGRRGAGAGRAELCPP